MSTPIIGITTRKDLTPAGLPAVMAQQAYIDAILQAGGAPVLIPSDLTEAGWRTLYQRLDGILFTGGGDIATEIFGGQPHPAVGGVDEARDSIELGLARSAAENGRPFLGICRGLQVANVALGGTLYTDIADQVANALKHNYEDADALSRADKRGASERTQLVHSVCIAAGSRMEEILGAPLLQVNSLHHQGIKDLALAFKPVAFAPDGIIEAIELPNHPFGLAVQWHPEWLTDQEATRRLFKAFVDAAGAEI